MATLKILNQYPYPDKEYDDNIKLHKKGQTLKGRFKYFKRKENNFYGKINNKNLLVVKQSQIKPLLRKIYNDAKTHKNGRESLYNNVKSKYIGISKRKMFDFLKNQENYQIHRPVIKEKVNRPIVLSGPHKQWQVDLVDLSNLSGFNKKQKWLLTCIDLFSKYAYVKTTPNKSGKRISYAMDSILSKLPKKHIPSVIQTDRGSEFQGEFNKIMKKYKIKHIFSTPYKPSTQGAVERFNGTIKRLLFSYMSNNKTKTYINVLEDIVDNYNSSIHRATGVSPKNIVDGISKEEQQKINNKISKAQRSLILEERNLPIIRKGDYVRIALESINKTVRKDANFRKKFLKQWTARIYQVDKVTRPKVGRPMYIINDPKLDKGEFYRDEIQLIDKSKLIKRKPVIKKKKIKLKKKKPKPVVKRKLPKRTINKPARFK